MLVKYCSFGTAVDLWKFRALEKNTASNISIYIRNTVFFISNLNVWCGVSHTTHQNGLRRINNISKSYYGDQSNWISLFSGKVRCEICKKKCTGDILRADEKYFHIACFACKSKFYRFYKQPQRQAGENSSIFPA